jgi:hypothetical protein
MRPTRSVWIHAIMKEADSEREQAGSERGPARSSATLL